MTETAIHALANLYHFTHTPMGRDWLTEFFSTHPAFTSRAMWGKTGRIPAERISELIHDAHVH